MSMPPLNIRLVREFHNEIRKSHKSQTARDAFRSNGMRELRDLTKNAVAAQQWFRTRTEMCDDDAKHATPLMLACATNASIDAMTILLEAAVRAGIIEEVIGETTLYKSNCVLFAASSKLNSRSFSLLMHYIGKYCPTKLPELLQQSGTSASDLVNALAAAIHRDLPLDSLVCLVASFSSVATFSQALSQKNDQGQNAISFCKSEEQKKFFENPGQCWKKCVLFFRNFNDGGRFMLNERVEGVVEVAPEKSKCVIQ